MSICGIYKFTNLINGKIYIGQSVNIKRRIREHFQIRDETPFHLALKKYGRENFTIEIIEECSEAELNEKEKYYISLYNSENKHIGYNRTSGGEGRSKKAVIQYDKNGIQIAVYESMSLAEAKTNIPAPNIQRCCSGKGHSAGGYQWRYEEDDAPGFYTFNRDEHLQKIRNSENHKNHKGGRPSKSASIIQRWKESHLTGNKQECIKDTGLSKSTVYRHWDL